MSTLSKLRARLVRIERRGKALKRELEELRSVTLEGPHALTRSEERQITRLDKELEDTRRDWARIHDLVKAEERRLIDNPTAFLHFT